MANIKWKIIDASGYVLGRLSSKVAKMALMGEHIVLINSQDVVISGNRRQILEHYKHYKTIKTASNPRKGPFRVGTRPDIFLRKTIKGMLPKNERGKLAIARVHCYIKGIPEDKKSQYGVPEEVELNEKYKASRLTHKYVLVSDVCEMIGWNKGGLK
ncbi:MAG: 50S ribosomal protein L13 [Promethearchaeota archaeon]